MKKNVVIRITNIQSEGPQMVENHEVTTKGTFTGNENDYTLNYIELFDENTKSNTTIRVNKKTVTLIRQGDFNYEFIIEQNSRHNCHYETPYGEFMLGIYGKSVESTVTENGGVLRLNYTLDFNAGFASENEMTIEFSVI